MQFGLLSLDERPNRSLADAWEEDLREVIEADRLGFQEAWITEHFGPLNVPIYPILGNHDYGDPQDRGGRLWTCGSPDPQAELDPLPC